MSSRAIDFAAQLTHLVAMFQRSAVLHLQACCLQTAGGGSTGTQRREGAFETATPPSVDLAILVALQEEFEVLFPRLHDPQPELRGDHTYYRTQLGPDGVVGYDPMDGRKLKHMHFALWRGGPRDAVDPAPLMRAFSRRWLV